MATPKPDPAELIREDLTAEQADGIVEGLAQIDRGEAVDGMTSFARLRRVLAQMIKVHDHNA